MKKLVVLLLTCGIICSCGTRSVRQEFTGSQNVFVGWLDLTPNDFRKWGYPTKEEWEKDIVDLNSGLRKFVGDYLKDFNVTGATKINDRTPANGYVILFSNVAIDPQASIVVDVTVKDAATGRIVKKFASYGTSFHMSYSMYAFTGKLNNACYALAYEIYMQMTE